MNDAREFAARLASLLRDERYAMAEFLVALADFDDRKVWMRLGHASLFSFLHRDLGLSKGASHFRKVAAELIERYPEVVEPLRDGRLCITSVVELAKVITPENRAEVLPRFFHASKQEARAVAAAVAPREVVPQRAVVTAVARTPPALAAIGHPAGLALREPVAVASPNPFHPGETPSAVAALPEPRPLSAAPVTAPRASAEPLTADLRR